jgi:hypothetical protein
VALFVVAPCIADTVTAAVVVTTLLLMAKVAELLPAAMCTYATPGTTAVLLAASSTSIPPVGAAALRVIVPVAELLPTSDVGETVSEAMVTDSGCSVRGADWLVEPVVPVSTTEVVDTTGAVISVLDDPDRFGFGIVNPPPGIPASVGLALVTAIHTPLAGRYWLVPVTVACAVVLFPPVTAVGVMENAAIPGGMIVSVVETRLTQLSSVAFTVVC